MKSEHTKRVDLLTQVIETAELRRDMLVDATMRLAEMDAAAHMALDDPERAEIDKEVDGIMHTLIASELSQVVDLCDKFTMAIEGLKAIQNDELTLAKGEN